MGDNSTKYCRISMKKIKRYIETMQPYDIFTREPISQKDYVETRKNK
jgi:hypothetical protein